MECPVCQGTGEIEAHTSSVGLLIRVARQARGMTQEELAALVGRSRPQITNIEAGRSSFDIKMLRTFADALGVPAKDLIP